MAATCKSCGAPVRWVSTARGAAIPLDPEPRDDGNIILIGGIAHVASHVACDGPWYVSHFTTCPNAAQHRKRT